MLNTVFLSKFAASFGSNNKLERFLSCNSIAVCGALSFFNCSANEVAILILQLIE